MHRTIEQKAEALRLVAEVGKAEAARRLGVPVGTVASWASRSGVRAPEVAEIRKHVETMQLTVAQRKGKLAETLLGTVEGMAGQMGGADAIDQQRRASAISTLVASMQLLSGEATERVEHLGGDKERAIALVRDIAEERRKQQGAA